MKKITLSIMKATIIKTATLLFLFSSYSFGQISKYDKGVNFELPYEEMRQAAQAKGNAYAVNREFRKSLMDWILDIKSKTNDTKLLDHLNKTYKYLSEMEGEDYADSGFLS